MGGSSSRVDRHWHSRSQAALKVSSQDKNEQQMLDRLFRELARRSPGKTMSKSTFLEFFRLPGIFGERLFHVFDRDGNGTISKSEFRAGLALFLHGDVSDRIKVLFEMFDLDNSGTLGRSELRLMFNSLVTPFTSDLSRDPRDSVALQGNLDALGVKWRRRARASSTGFECGRVRVGAAIAHNCRAGGAGRVRRSGHRWRRSHRCR
ncbi:MAG: hypothetical protein MHM6MM_009017 [Cercozoa sp. M6MM]